MSEALNLLKEIDDVLNLGQKGLLRVDEAAGVEKRTKEFLKASFDPNSELGREYEKWNKGTWWKTESRDGFANDSHLAPLKRLREFLTRFLDDRDIDTSPSQQYIKTGEVYSGRKALRDILKKAKSKIDIQDNYLDHEIFSILEPYFKNSSSLISRLLTSNKVKKSFNSDFTLFFNQFGRIEAKTHNQAHGRFIILDDKEIFSIGHSLKDVGKKADVVSKIESDEAKKQVLDDFNNWWNNGNKINP